MNVLEQGLLFLDGLEVTEGLHEACLEEGFNKHAVFKGIVWLRADVTKQECDRLWLNCPVKLKGKGSTDWEPLFSGLLKKAEFVKIDGRPAMRIEIFSYTVLMDNEKRTRSYQYENRTYQELVELLIEPYQGAFIWHSENYMNSVGRFLIQYQETDWKYLQRIASYSGEVILADITQEGVKIHVGLPRKEEVYKIETPFYRIKKTIHDDWEKIDENYTGGLVRGTEIEIAEIYEDYRLGTRIIFGDKEWVIAGKKSELKNALWVHQYQLKKENECRTSQMNNRVLAGSAITGEVKEVALCSNRLKLETDGDNEVAESWHVQPVYYVGEGKGYSGQPEKKDEQKLYFPTECEEDRYIISGTDAGEERIQAIISANAAQSPAKIAQPPGEPPWFETQTPPSPATPPTSSGGSHSGGGYSGGGGSRVSGGSAGGSNQKPIEEIPVEDMDKTKSWTSPDGQSLTLDETTISLCAGAGGGSGLSLSGDGISVVSNGDMFLIGLAGKNCSIGGEGRKINLSAQGSILINSEASVILMTPEMVEMTGTNVILQSPENVERDLISEEGVAYLLGLFEDYKKEGAPMYAADGSIIQREGFDDIIDSQELYDYFMTEILGKEGLGYENLMGQPPLTVYDGWLGDTYGKTSMQKFDAYLFSLQGLHDILDVVGFFFDGADLVNALVYLCEGDFANAGLSGIGAIPLLGDIIGKGIKGGKKVVGAVGNVISTGWKGTQKVVTRGISEVGSVMNRMEFVIKTTKEGLPQVLKNIDNVVDQLKRDMKMYPNLALDTGTGMKFSLNSASEISFLVSDSAGEIKNIIVKFGDDLAAAAKTGDNAADVIAGVTKNADELTDAAKKIGGTSGFKNISLENLTDDLLASKPLNSKNPETWIKKGGKIEIDELGNWKYTNQSGKSVTYTNGYPDFSPYKHPNVEPVKIEVATPKNYANDYVAANKSAGLGPNSNPPVFDMKKPPEGYRWHHMEDGKTMMLVEKDIHTEFLHAGGQSIINGKGV